MTRKHFEMLAAVLKSARMCPAGTTVETTVDFIAVELAAKLREENPRFDRERFIKATGAK